MIITLDGVNIEANCGETLLSIIERAGLLSKDMKEKPLAAQIGGEIYQLNYDPIHMVDGEPKARSAVSDANGIVKLLRYGDAQGRRVYERTLTYVFMLAVKRLFPDARTLIKYALGDGLYIEIEKSPALNENETSMLYDECLKIVRDDLPLTRMRLAIDDAIRYFSDDGQMDKVRLLQWRKFSFFDVYRQGGYMNYFYGEMAPSTGFVQIFGLVYLRPGAVLMMPDPSNPNKCAAYRHSPKLAAVFHESDDWLNLLHCNNVADLNDAIANGSVRELARISEALHEKSYSQIADRIVKRGSRIIMLAGPSSSGKTTSAHRLYTHLRVLGQSPVLVSLDNYYIDRDKLLPDENGEVDLEHIDTIDVAQIRADLELLIAGERVDLPIFDFKTGKRSTSSLNVQIGPNEPLIIEGIHGLNPALLSDAMPADSVFRLYVSALTALNLDDHNRIPTTEIRMLRRIVRDYETRGASVEKTLSMWQSVRAGEEKWIFPYQEQADAFLNTALVYEPALLKKHIFPLLLEIDESCEYYMMVKYLKKFLNYFAVADIEDEIPPTSVLREFIGGSAFFREAH